MNFISRIKKYSLLAIAASFIIGVLFAAFPEKSKDAVSLVIGLSLVASGVAGIIRFIVKDKQLSALITGVMTIVFGIIISLNILPILNVIVGAIGVLLILFGLFNLFVALRLISSSGIFGWISLALSVLSIVFGGIAVANTNETTVAVFRFLGIALIVYAVLDIISYFQVRRFIKDINDAVDIANDNGEIVTEGELINDGKAPQESPLDDEEIETQATIIDSEE